MRLYVYASIDNALKIVKSSSLALSSPKTFNDPFDCLALWSSVDLEETKEIFNSYILERAFLDLIREKKENTKSRLLKSYCSFVSFLYESRKRKMTKKNIKYKPILNFTIFEMLLDIMTRYCNDENEQRAQNEAIKLKIESFKREEEIKFSQVFEIRDSIYVGCLSTCNTSILMWSHYADKHRGVCIEFEVEDDPAHLFKVDYEENRPKIQASRFVKEYCRHLIVGVKHEHISQDPLMIKMIVQPYITKSTQWEHECEYRLIYTEKELRDKNIERRTFDDGIERYLYPMNKIKRIYAGVAISEESVNKLKDELSNKSILLVPMKISKNKYGITPQKEHVVYDADANVGIECGD